MNITTAQLEAWIGLYLWPFVRIGACLMVAPIFGNRSVPRRIRLILAAAMSVAIAPLLTFPQSISLLSGEGFVVTAHQVVIGLAMGFALQIVFEAVAMGGQLLASSMGLSFAMNVDPVNGANTPVLGQFYGIVVTLVFLALDGHLALIQALVDGFTTLPVGTQGLSGNGLWTLVNWGGQLFTGALSVALPGIAALLIVNLGFGVMSRAAPTLNLFAVGFPAALALGLVIALATLPVVQNSFVSLLTTVWQTLAMMLGGAA
jgi:flagellar biosynthetic protein FliR